MDRQLQRSSIATYFFCHLIIMSVYSILNNLAEKLVQTAKSFWDSSKHIADVVGDFVIFSPVKGSESLQNLTLSCAPLTALFAKFWASPARLLALSPISEVLPTCSQKHSKVFQICLKKPIRPKSCDTKEKRKEHVVAVGRDPNCTIYLALKQISESGFALIELLPGFCDRIVSDSRGIGPRSGSSPAHKQESKNTDLQTVLTT